MFAFFYNVILLAASAEHGSESAFTRFYNTYLNIPGFEIWKFVNLAIFVAILVYVLKKPLTETFKAKREAIRAELIKAEEARVAALAQLTAAEAKLSAVESEKAALIKKAK